MCNERMPIMGLGIYLPLSMFSKERCHKNHGQTPERLAARGGLDAVEALAVIRDVSYFELHASKNMPMYQAIEEIRGLANV